MEQLLVILWILTPIVVTAVYAVLAFLLYGRLRRRAQIRARRPRSIWDELAGVAAGWPLALALVLAGLLLLVTLLPLPGAVRAVLNGSLRIALVAALVFFGHQLVAGFYRVSPEGHWLRTSSLRKLTLFAIYLIGALMLLALLGVPTGALLVMLAASAAAVTLALRDVLTHYIAGIHFHLDRSLEPGHSITLEDGTSGELLRLGWLKSYIREADGSRLTIPNGRLLNVIMMNHSEAGAGPVDFVTLRVSRQADLDQAQKIAESVLERLAPTTGPRPVAGPARAVYTELDSEHAELMVRLHARNYRNLPQLRSDYIKAVHKALAKAGIDLA